MTASAWPASGVPAVDVDGPLARWARRGLLAIGVWIAAFVLWCIFAPIAGAVVGMGLVKVEANRQTVTHRDGGNVAQVLVREGQFVERGQTLVVLEDARLDSSFDLLRAQLAAERLRKSRLEAEAALQPTWSAPAAGLSDVPPDRLRDALARERGAFDARRRSLDGQTESVQAQIADTRKEIAAYQRNTASSVQALALLRDEIEANEALLQENFVNRTRVLALRRNLSDYESRIESNEAELAKARQRVAELEGKVDSLQRTYVQSAAEDLRESNARVVDLEERVRAARDAAGRQVIAAPVAGRLVGLKVNTVGSALGPREPVVDIVPMDQPLVIEARVSAEAVTEVRVGQPADVRLLGARQRSTTTLDGRVAAVSADALVDSRTGGAYFAVQVEVDAAHVRDAGLPPLTPGMAAEVYLRTSARTPLEFLLEPLTAGMRRGFREH